MTTQRFKSLVTIVTLLCLLLGTCTMVWESCKIVTTGAYLIILRGNAIDYNDSYIKTDKMTEEYLENQAEREKLYQSEDTVVRVYSNLPGLIKFLVWILAMCAVPGVPFMVFIYVASRVYAIKIIRERQMQRRRQSRSK